MSDVQIGKSQVYASTLGLGTNKIGGHNLFKNLDDEVGKEVLRTALRNGVTLLDTAYAYGFGQSEKLIGEVLQEAEFDRARVIIATKAAQVPGNEEQLDNHFPDEATKKNEAVKALHELKEAGKIRAIGVSNFSLTQIKEANLDGYVDVVEDNYNLLHRKAETELFPYLAKHNISFIPYFPLASGLLSGKYTADQKFAENDSRSKKADFTGERYQKIIATMTEMKIIAHRNDATVPQLVLAWYLKNPHIAAVIPGARNRYSD